VTETLVDEDPSSPSRAVSHCGSITTASPTAVDFTDTPALTPDNSSIKDGEEDALSLTSLKRRRLTGFVTNYPGQFESYEWDYLDTHARENSTLTTLTLGDPTHPNGRYTHTNFLRDPVYPATNYTKTMLDANPLRELALKHAESKSASFSVPALRSPAEEMLRREVHRECSAARLEGVGVGEFRYYQGFMSLEDYVRARLCVCWGGCWCSKVCTLFGDVLCPCSEWVEVHGDD
jgi:hypothetical protein